MPEAYAELGSIEFAKLVINECDVAVSPGVGFGPSGDGFVRFALIENEQRIGQAVRQQGYKRRMPEGLERIDVFLPQRHAGLENEGIKRGFGCVFIPGRIGFGIRRG